jgi:hypothetical protein
MIRFEAEINAEELLSDVFSGCSFVVREGFETWDPRAWSVEEGFRRKWGALFR